MNRSLALKVGIIFIVLAFPLSATTESPYHVATEISEDVGTRYIAAYFGKDWEALSGLLSDQALFEDPTAPLVFGPVMEQGKDNILRYFIENYSDFDMDFNIKKYTFSGNIAMFDLTLDWSFTQEGKVIVVEKMPMLIILRIQDGKVLVHHDYAVYNKLLNALKDANNNG